MAWHQYPEAMGTGVIGFVFSAAICIAIIAVASLIVSSLFSGIDSAKVREDARHGNDGAAFSMGIVFLMLLAAGLGTYMVASMVIAVATGIVSTYLSIGRVASIQESDGAERTAWMAMSLLKAVSIILVGIWLLVPGESLVDPPIFAVAVLVLALMADLGLTRLFSIAGGGFYRGSAQGKMLA